MMHDNCMCSFLLFIIHKRKQKSYHLIALLRVLTLFNYGVTQHALTQHKECKGVDHSG